MAQGDIRAEITSIAANSFLTIQPAAGESWILKDVFAAGNGTDKGGFRLYDGTDNSPMVDISVDDLNLNSYRMRVGSDLKYDYIQNALYIQVYNRSATAKKCGVIALQIK